jgi:hypothetical protein
MSLALDDRLTISGGMRRFSSETTGAMAPI